MGDAAALDTELELATPEAQLTAAARTLRVATIAVSTWP
jgi:hypothetical protein